MKHFIGGWAFTLIFFVAVWCAHDGIGKCKDDEERDWQASNIKAIFWFLGPIGALAAWGLL